MARAVVFTPEPSHMAHLFSFTSGAFPQAAERPNPTNPIGGDGLLQWLGEQLRQATYALSSVEPEDWGWFCTVTVGADSYMLGASGDWEDDGTCTEWSIQLHRNRSTWDKLRGRNALTAEDPFSARIESILRGAATVSNLTVDRRTA